MPIKLIAKVATHPLADSPVVVILSCVAVICAMLLLAIGPSVSQQQKSRKQPLKMWISLQNVRVGINGVSVDADIIIKGTKVDGVYSADPELDPEAKKLDSLTYK